MITLFIIAVTPIHNNLFKEINRVLKLLLIFIYKIKFGVISNGKNKTTYSR